MDLLRLVLCHQTLDKLNTLPTLFQSQRFLRLRGLVRKGVQFEGDYLLYVGICTRYRELSRMAPLYLDGLTLIDEAMFQQNVEMFNYFANLHPRLVNVWEALKTGVPEIQAKALSLLHDDPNSIDQPRDPFEGNVLFNSQMSESEIPWTDTLYKEVRDYILKTRVIVGRSYHPKMETDGSVRVDDYGSSSEDDEERGDISTENQESEEKEDPNLELDGNYIANTGTVCGFFDVTLPRMDSRGFTLPGVILKHTHGDDVIHQIPVLDNIVQIKDVQHLIACVGCGYLYPIISNMEVIFGLANGIISQSVYSAAAQNARIPVIMAFSSRMGTFPVKVEASVTQKTIERMKLALENYADKIDPQIIDKYKVILGVTPPRPKKPGKASFLAQRTGRLLPPEFFVPGTPIRGFPGPLGIPMWSSKSPDPKADLRRVFYNDDTFISQEDIIRILHAVKVEKKVDETLVTIHKYVPGTTKVVSIPRLENKDVTIGFQYARRAFLHLLDRNLILATDEKLGGFLLPDLKAYLLERADRFQRKYVEILARLKGSPTAP